MERRERERRLIVRRWFSSIFSRVYTSPSLHFHFHFLLVTAVTCRRLSLPFNSTDVLILLLICSLCCSPANYSTFAFIINSSSREKVEKVKERVLRFRVKAAGGRTRGGGGGESQGESRRWESMRKGGRLDWPDVIQTEMYNIYFFIYIDLFKKLQWTHFTT